MCPCPEKKGLWAKAKSWVKDNPETATAIGTAIAGAALMGYEAYSGCDRYDILIEYKLMHACVQNCAKVFLNGNASKKSSLKMPK